MIVGFPSKALEHFGYSLLITSLLLSSTTVFSADDELKLKDSSITLDPAIAAQYRWFSRKTVLNPNPSNWILGKDEITAVDSLIVQRFLLSATASETRFLDFIANTPPGVARDIFASVLIERDAGSIASIAGVEIDEFGKKSKSARTKVISKLIARALSKIEDDPKHINGSRLAKFKKTIANMPLGVLAITHGSDYKAGYFEDRLFLPNQEYKNLYLGNSDARHELSLKIAILRRVASGGKLTREERGLFPFNPEQSRPELNSMFEDISELSKLGSGSFPNYDNKESIRTLSADRSV